MLLFFLSLCFADGQSTYKSLCSSCHQASGGGIDSLYPPLAGSDWVSKDKDILIKIVLHGLKGEIVVSGVTYSLMEMSPQGRLSDKEVADVLNFVRNSWENKSSEVILESDVSKVRSSYPGHSKWTAAELLK